MSEKKPSPAAYIGAHAFLKLLRAYQSRLTAQQMRTLRGQAIAGDVDGAVKGLGRMLLRRDGEI